jgi:hypothetical protein
MKEHLMKDDTKLKIVGSLLLTAFILILVGSALVTGAALRGNILLLLGTIMFFSGIALVVVSVIIFFLSVRHP